ncbi:hypothetical protein HYDPIDRAFT_116499 [Hydnomerulius pinastri MD-312]|uniref:Uncharacterized protein n=1 Tax=Hydnomerulius pinastri MD-312 TaxID=994086 RepID=A0A0C9V5X0_9AGAM|nr:hypothetical protein HYDPIDRAFT_116499 [Hydnomerulius pinastri MD-312]
MFQQQGSVERLFMIGYWQEVRRRLERMRLEENALLMGSPSPIIGPQNFGCDGRRTRLDITKQGAFANQCLSFNQPTVEQVIKSYQEPVEHDPKRQRITIICISPSMFSSGVHVKIEVVIKRGVVKVPQSSLVSSRQTSLDSRKTVVPTSPRILPDLSLSWRSHQVPGAPVVGWPTILGCRWGEENNLAKAVLWPLDCAI